MPNPPRPTHSTAGEAWLEGVRRKLAVSAAVPADLAQFPLLDGGRHRSHPQLGLSLGRTMLEVMPALLARAQEAARLGRGQDEIEAAHALKGSAQALGSPRLTEACDRWLSSLRAGHGAAAAEGAAQARSVALDLEALLRAELRAASL